MLTLNRINTGNALLFQFPPCCSRNSCSSKPATVAERCCLVSSAVLEERTPSFLRGSFYVPSGDDLCCISAPVFGAMVEPHTCLDSVEQCRAFLKRMQGLRARSLADAGRLLLQTAIHASLCRAE